MTIAVIVLAALGALLLVAAVVSDLRHWRHSACGRAPPASGRARNSGWPC